MKRNKLIPLCYIMPLSYKCTECVRMYVERGHSCLVFVGLKSSRASEIWALNFIKHGDTLVFWKKTAAFKSNIYIESFKSNEPRLSLRISKTSVIIPSFTCYKFLAVPHHLLKHISRYLAWGTSGGLFHFSVSTQLQFSLHRFQH